jgi:hypothetical protein
MVMDRKARLKGDEWARIWTYEAARVAREGAHRVLYCCTDRTLLLGPGSSQARALHSGRWVKVSVYEATQQWLRIAS